MEDRGDYVWVGWREWLHNSGSVINPRWEIKAPPVYLVKHHTPGIDPGSYQAAVEALNGVWHFHTFRAEGNGWGWIGYNTVGWDKFIFEGAGVGKRGVHAPGANGISHGHAFLLDSRTRQPTGVEWSALRGMCVDLVAQRKMNPEVLVHGSGFNTVHHDWFATACAGPGVDDTAVRFYATNPAPNPVPGVLRKRRGSMQFVARQKGGQVAQFGPNQFGIQWASRVYDCYVPAGHKVGVIPIREDQPEITVSAIVNGNQLAPRGTRLDSPYVIDVPVDSFITICVPYDVVPNISVG